ncbi:semaphorin-1A-like [Artemia franciscana]|uniref:Semaphorin-1A n=1 Tax=Artemia franciscana TaxID=6661 RepID=A0AA88H991_ARTSF|nr:hypothetical protein QYM36_016948 [Artemia franciscana]
MLGLLLWFIGIAWGWQENVRPKMYVQYGLDDMLRFQGNASFVDHFRLLETDRNWLLVGARNKLYNLTATTLQENQGLDWFTAHEHVQMCLLKGRNEDECHNYLRLLAIKSPGKIVLCGTHAFKPMCRDYSFKDGQYVLDKQYSGQGLSPYDPSHNTTAVMVDGDLYVGTVADFSGADPLIYREPLRTEQYDAMHMSAPNFVSSFGHGEHVYFLFRETAIEYMNCGKSIYSRIARVCKQDRGGPHRFKFRWTTFLKGRLNCSIPGDFPFYFNEIQSMSGPFEGKYGGKRHEIIYATFTTPSNSIIGSAVCAFRMEDIEAVFDGAFKEQAGLNANWLSVPSQKVPEPRPGQCVNDSQTLPDITLNFIKSHPLMDDSVPAYLGEPLLIKTGIHYRFTKIAVDPQFRTPDGKVFDVMFIGTYNGKVIKAVNAESTDTATKSVRPVIIEEIQVFSQKVAITHMTIHRRRNPDGTISMESGRLIVMADDEIVSLKLQRCYTDKIRTCSECVALQDPYCAWDKRKSKCVSYNSAQPIAYLQSVQTGVHPSCPDSKVQSRLPSKDNANHPPFVPSSSVAEPSIVSHDVKKSSNRNAKEFMRNDDMVKVISHNHGRESYDDGPRISGDESIPLYTVETLVIAVAAGSLVALFVGFGAGYCCGKKCKKDEEDNLPYPDTEYEYFEQRQNCARARLAQEQKLLQSDEATYAEPILVPALNKPLNTNSRGSPKPQIRKLTNNVIGSTNVFDSSPNNAFPFAEGPRDPYASFRSRDTFSSSARFTPQQQPLINGVNGHTPLDDRDTFGTLRNNKNIGDGFGTARSGKKVYL